MEHKPYDTLGGLISKAKWYSSNYMKKIFYEKGIEITHEQWVLIIIINKNQGITQTELSKSAQKDKASVTRMLDILEREKYINRKNDDKDRRSYRIFLTKKGVDIFHKTLPLIEIVENDMLQNLTPEEVITMKNCLVKICDTSRELLK